MPISDADSAEASVREWLRNKFGSTAQDVYFESVRREAAGWSVDVQFMISGSRKFYSISLDAATGSVLGYNERFRPFSFPPPISTSKGTAGALMLGALIVSVIVVIVFISSGLTNILTGIFTLYPSTLGGISRMILGVFLVAFGLIDIYITTEINSVRGLLEQGDIKGALERNSISLGVIALILDGIVPGILLLIAREEMSVLDRRAQAA